MTAAATTAASGTQVPPTDTHESQAERIADHCERNAARFFSTSELALACDVACASKVLSAMALTLGYVLEKAWRTEPCANGLRVRRVRTYRVLSRPVERQLSLPLKA